MTVTLEQQKSKVRIELQTPAPNGKKDTVYLYTDGLEAELRQTVQGEVRFDDGSRALYATDASNYRQPPIGVVIPKDKNDVIATVAACRRYGVPILGRGGGTSLAGQCCNAAVVIDMSKYMNQVLWIDPDQKLARVQAGIVLDDLQNEAKKHGLIFGPDPATHSHCTLGGMIGNNSCGIHSVMAQFYGPGPRTADNVQALEILTYEGLHLEVGPTSAEELERITQEDSQRGALYRKLRDLGAQNADLIRARYPHIPRRVSGYENLDHLLPGSDFNVAQALVGTESTCVFVLEATVHLIENPGARSLLVVGYADVYHAADHLMDIMAHKPIGLEGLDQRLLQYQQTKGMHPDALALLPDGKAFLLVEFKGADKQESDQHAQDLMDALRQQDHAPTGMKLFDDPPMEQKLWEVRESSLGATARIPGMPDTWPGWEDSAVPPEKLKEYLRDFRQLLNKYNYDAALYGHFGQGLIHCRITFDLYTADGLENFHAFLEEAADLVVRYGGSLSGEHGDGQARAELLIKMYGKEMLDLFRQFKSIWDPEGKMNPGKVVDPYPILSNLRIGTDYNPWRPQTYFQFPEDDGNFARAVLRCVGVGKCRREAGGTMCPSYMVTREEEHTTRGRARALFEMLQGNVLTEGWKSEHVKETLDLCLSCKGCKGDCPVNVDMATYKAEFLAHYYEGRLRPMTAYTMGLIYWWAGLAAYAPTVANFFTQTPVLSGIVKRLGGIAPQRSIPQFARQTFKAWFQAREPRNQDKPKVILWPDTFNNHFHPEVAIAAVEVLETVGYQVIVPQQALCCGRPLYDYGFLQQARVFLQEIIGALRSEIRAGVPVVGLEPSCVSVFRDELKNMFPQDEDARRLNQQTLTLGEFLERYAADFAWPPLQRKALVHGHCHHKSILGMDAEKKLLSKLGMDTQWPETGCCGLAGAFGYEADKYAISLACGERVLLPAVRSVDEHTLIITEGFSCRSQIQQETSRTPLHLAQVLQMALRQSPAGPQIDPPETAVYLRFTPNGGARQTALGKLALATGAVIAGGALLWRLGQRTLSNRSQ